MRLRHLESYEDAWEALSTGFRSAIALREVSSVDPRVEYCDTIVVDLADRMEASALRGAVMEFLDHELISILDRSGPIHMPLIGFRVSKGLSDALCLALLSETVRAGPITRLRAIADAKNPRLSAFGRWAMEYRASLVSSELGTLLEAYFDEEEAEAWLRGGKPWCVGYARPMGLLDHAAGEALVLSELVWLADHGEPRWQLGARAYLHRSELADSMAWQASTTAEADNLPAEVRNRLFEVFPVEHERESWLETSNYRLAGAAPAALLQVAEGTPVVLRELSRLLDPDGSIRFPAPTLEVGDGEPNGS